MSRKNTGCTTLDLHQEIQDLRAEVVRLCDLLKETRRFDLGTRVPNQWFIARDKAIHENEYHMIQPKDWIPRKEAL